MHCNPPRGLNVDLDGGQHIYCAAACTGFRIQESTSSRSGLGTSVCDGCAVHVLYGAGADGDANPVGGVPGFAKALRGLEVPRGRGGADCVWERGPGVAVAGGALAPAAMGAAAFICTVSRVPAESCTQKEMLAVHTHTHKACSFHTVQLIFMESTHVQPV
eukprot:1153036-Pelagomonas_calceolata.AAC.3